MDKNKTIMESLKENKEYYDYKIKGINEIRNEINYLFNVNIYQNNDKWFCFDEFKNNLIHGLETKENLNIHIKREIERLFYGLSEITKLENTILTTENIIKEMLKYFSNDLKGKTKGMVLKLLDKTYNNSLRDKGLNGYSVKLYQMINFSIENNIDFYLQFKTLENNCLKVFDDECNKWI